MQYSSKKLKFLCKEPPVPPLQNAFLMTISVEKCCTIKCCGSQSGGCAAHAGAPMLCKYATMSLLLLRMASLRGVRPFLQGSE